MEAIDHIILSASIALSGAKQAAPDILCGDQSGNKGQVRVAASGRVKTYGYHGRMKDEWVKDPVHLGTNCSRSHF
ncbi:MAG: hypothetical protein IPI23_16755 [Bacteroidetes bacterium]|nr:hypothetical protein [Bacteroidota bacterium]